MLYYGSFAYMAEMEQGKPVDTRIVPIGFAARIVAESAAAVTGFLSFVAAFAYVTQGELKRAAVSAIVGSGIELATLGFNKFMKATTLRRNTAPRR